MGERITPEIDTRQTGGRFWRLALLIIVGIVALLAAVPLAEFLHEQLWTMHYDNLFKRYGQMGFAYGPPYRIIAMEDSNEANRNYTIRLFVYLLPTILLMILLFRRAAPWIGILLIFLFPCMLISLLQITELQEFTKQEFTFIGIIWFLSGLVMALILMLRRALLPLQQSKAPVLEAEHTQNIGIGRNPWKAWLILAIGFIALQAAVPVAKYLNDFVWEMLAAYRIHGGGHGYYWDVVDHENGYYFEGLRYALYSGFLYVIPFLFLALAIRWNMKPWCAIVFGLICGICLSAVIFALESSYEIYERISYAFLVSQFFSVIGFLLLASYHQRVSKIQFESDDDLSD